MRNLSTITEKQMAAKYLFLLFPYFLGLFLLSSCNEEMISREERVALHKQIQNRKPRKISDAEILTAAANRGQHIAFIYIELLKNNENSLPDSLVKDVYKWQVVNKANAEKTVQGKEKEVWQAYQYAIEQDVKPTANVQKVMDTQLLYSYPFLQQDGTWAMLSIIFEKNELVKYVPAPEKK